MDWDRLGEAVGLAVRFLDNAIDAGHYPIPQIREITLGNRKVGLGIMGFADALAPLGVPYNSPEAVSLAGEVGRFLRLHAHQASESLAANRGCFPNWAGSTWDTEHHRPMRNATCTTIAPTGSISILARCSSGIEPIFGVVSRRRALGREFVEVHPLVERLGRQQGWLTARVRAALLEGLPPKGIQGFPRELAELLITAHEVSPEWHVRVQAAFQKHIDNAVSKTVNLRADATVAEVDRTFRLAHELGCKGITVYRDDSQPNQTLSALPRGSSNVAKTGLSPRQRPRSTTGQTIKFRMGCGTLFVTVNRDGQGPCEVFANLGKAGGCPSQSEATCRAVSAALRLGVEPRVLVEQLKGIRCFSTLAARQAGDGVEVPSCPDCFGVGSGDGR
jgi:ribonucleoside-diphosphate reductase alpha chain